MFPVIMLILQFLWRRFHLWIDQFTAACHLCHFLKYNCIVHCLMRIFTPGKRSVVFAKDCRNSLIIKLAEIICDQNTRIFLICLFNLFFLSDFGHMELLHKYNPHALFHNTG